MAWWRICLCSNGWFEEESSTHTSHNGRHFLLCRNGTVCSAIGIVTRIPNDHIQQQQELSCPPFSESALTFSSLQSLLLLLSLFWVPLNLSLSRASFCFERQLNEICVLLQMAKTVSKKKERKAKKVQEKAQFAEIDRRLEQGKRFLFLYEMSLAAIVALGGLNPRRLQQQTNKETHLSFSRIEEALERRETGRQAGAQRRCYCCCRKAANRGCRGGSVEAGSKARLWSGASMAQGRRRAPGWGITKHALFSRMAEHHFGQAWSWSPRCNWCISSNLCHIQLFVNL